MRLLFDLDFDSTPWPGPLGNKKAVMGEMWVGETGLLQVLETRLGLTGRFPGQGERVFRLAGALRKRGGFWSASAQKDAVGTAARVLAMRDELWMCGWRGQEGAGRLKELASLEEAVLPGVPDRLARVVEALTRRSADIDEVQFLDASEGLPRIWKQVLEQLQKRGTSVEHQPLLPAEVLDPGSDLGRSRTPHFEPVGDGSLQLVRSPGLLRAADDVAAWLAAEKDLTGTVVISADPVLDEALRRFGLPTTGAGARQDRPTDLAILPLLLELGWEPADPRQARELLALPNSPVPKFLAGPLLEALSAWPAVGSPDWEEALSKGLTHVPDDQDRAKLKQRIEGIFGAEVPRTRAYPLAVLQARLGLLEQWLRGKLSACDPAQEPWFTPGLEQCAALRKLIAAYGQEDLLPSELSLLVEQATLSVPLDPPYPAQAGLAAVSSPAGVAGPARTIVWWNFTLSAGASPEAWQWSPGERQELVALGVRLPDRARQAIERADKWRRPFQQAFRTVLLVCPERTAAGEAESPHPTWDEVRSGVPDSTLVARLVVRRPLHPTGCKQVERPLRTLPVPVEVFSVEPGRIAPRDHESASSLASMLECPLGYVLERLTDLNQGGLPSLSGADSPLLRGNLAHRFLAQLFGSIRDGAAPSPEEAQTQVESWFDQEGPTLAAELFLPQRQADRVKLRRQIGLAASELLRHIRDNGWTVIGVEEKKEGDALGTKLTGRIDLLLGPEPRVIDHKWSGVSTKEEGLEQGVACQLATYSRLARQDNGPYPPVAYFIVSRALILATDQASFGSLALHEGPSPQVTFEAMDRTHASVLQELRQGKLRAAGNSTDGAMSDKVKAGFIQAGQVVLKPSCNYCSHAALCGQTFGGE